MPLILAIEPDRRQAAQLKALARARIDADLVLADTTERALEAIGDRTPDLVLVPALLSPQDDAALAAALRVIAAAAHVQTLTIPAFAAPQALELAPAGVLAKLLGARSDSAPAGCDPAIFAEQITAYLAKAAAERGLIEPEPAVEPEAPAPQEPVAVESVPQAPVAVESVELVVDGIDFSEFMGEMESATGAETIVLEPMTFEPPAPEPRVEPAPQQVADRPARLEWTPLPIAALQAWPQLYGTQAESAARQERPDWLELVESLRQDLERRRSDNTQPSAVEPAPTTARKKRRREPVPVQDEWGFFDPEQCGFAALIAKLDEITKNSDNAIS